jgi:flavin-dependent dehydrogenase
VSAWDVIVAGAGPAGSATAALLAARGARVLLVERAVFPRAKPCAEYLSPEAGRLLDALGVLDEVSRGAARLTGMRVISPSGRAFEGRFRPIGGAAPFRPWGLALPRERLDAILAAAAIRHGAVLREGTALEAFTASRAGVSATLRAGAARDTVRAAVLVGADGLRSHVARALGVARRRGPERLAFVTHVPDVRGMGDVGEMHVVRGGYVGLADVGGGLTNVAAVVDRAALPPGRSARDRLERLLDRVPAVRARLPALLLHPVLAVGPFGRSTRRATGDAVTLVGDAADFYDPFTGEGIFAALRGAELLAPHLGRVLSTGAPDAAALAAYDRDRRRTFAGKWALERAIGTVVRHPVLLNHVAGRLAGHADTADLLIGATGDFVPARQVFHPAVAWRLVA